MGFGFWIGWLIDHITKAGRGRPGIDHFKLPEIISPKRGADKKERRLLFVMAKMILKYHRFDTTVFVTF